MNTQELIDAFFAGAGIDTDGEDTTTLGYLLPKDAPAGVAATMQRHVQEVQTALAHVPPDSIEALELAAIRAFTYDEFLALFDNGIKPEDYKNYPVYNALHIHNIHERRRWLIYSVNNEYEAYLRVLSQCLTPHPQSSLLNFFFPAHAVGTCQNQRAYGHYR